MVKVNLKIRLRFLNKSKAIESNTSTFGLEENFDTNATWFQSMEPITYAKKMDPNYINSKK